MAQAWSSGRWNWALTSAIWIAAIVRASCDGGYDGESTSGGVVAALASIRGRGDDHACTGVLVAENAVLAVAHCLVENEIEFPRVHLKAIGSNGWESSSDEVFTSSKAVVHASYNGVAGSESDLAIIFLDGSTSLPVPYLAESDDFFESEANYEALLYIWSEVEFRIPLKGIPQSMCSELYPSGESRRNICAKRVQSGPCQSMPGVPLIVNGHLFGLNLKSQNCADSETPQVFASIPALVPWIKDTLDKDGEVGTPQESSTVDVDPPMEKDEETAPAAAPSSRESPVSSALRDAIFSGDIDAAASILSGPASVDELAGGLLSGGSIPPVMRV